MSKSDYQRKLDELMLELKPAFISLGFKKKNRSFYRQKDDFWQLIHFQSSQFGTGSHNQFTINVGLTPFVLGAKPPSVDVDCQLRDRIGLICGENDKWWTVTWGSDLKPIIADIKERLSTCVLPWLNDKSKSLIEPTN